MVGGGDILGDRRSPEEGELAELVENGFGDGETAYVDEVLLDVPTDSVPLEDENASDRKLKDNGSHVGGDDGGGGGLSSDRELVNSGLHVVGDGGGGVSCDIDTARGD
jgi:hypothetical protein